MRPVMSSLEPLLRLFQEAGLQVAQRAPVGHARHADHREQQRPHQPDAEHDQIAARPGEISPVHELPHRVDDVAQRQHVVQRRERGR